jgi:hypothetical protein
MLNRTCLTITMMLIALPLRAQVESSGAQPAATGMVETTDDRMVTPMPVGIGGYSLAFATETARTNYVKGGMTFGTAYDDNILPSSTLGISDVSYSVWPTISLNQSRSRLRWDLSYSPGFTFYQRNSSYNEADHNLTFAVEYRLSPHVTLTVDDSFQKTSNPLNLTIENPNNSNSGVPQRTDTTIVPTLTNVISNFGDVEVTYQFGADSMVGAKGTVSGLWYPNRNQIPGLFDSSSRAGDAFYTHRLVGRHYVGVTYQFQNLLSRPSPVDTHTQSLLFFYTLNLPSGLSLSLLAGPEHSFTQGGNLLLNRWSPSAGASIGWQGAHTSFAATYSRKTSEGGGLRVAVLSNNTGVSARWQLTKALTAGLAANYSINNVVDSSLGDTGGHTVSGAFSLERSLGENLRMRVSYTRLHQKYSDFFVASNIPDRDYVLVSFSYQFKRPLGR